MTINTHDSNGEKFHKKYYDSDGHTVNTSALGDHSHLYDEFGNPLNGREVMLAHKKARKKEESRKNKEKWLKNKPKKSGKGKDEDETLLVGSNKKE